ncbi:MAG TPA: GNAT family N-acetyltransferase [Solirubrobacteraceae bacterium]|nr:GNAT family N-acetyltransferase [Solirubrobacteraceae bacterium]
MAEQVIVSRCRIDLAEGRWLRLLERDDTTELHEVVEANREHLAQWLPWAVGQTVADTLSFVERAQAQLLGNEGFQAAVVERGRIVGMVGFHHLSWESRSASVGYWLAESAQGRGTMTLAVRALVDHAFGTWGLERVEIRAGVENVRSGAVAERLGFTREAVVPAAERIGDRSVDQVVYALVARSDIADERRRAAAADLARAGGGDAPVEIVAYDATWPASFAAERERLTPLLAGAELHHFGSTSVAGVAAKPVIDMIALVPDLDAPIPALVASAGYRFPRAYNATLVHRRFLCFPNAARRTHHLHLVDDREELDLRLRFRDRLRADRTLAEEYEALK